MAVKVSKNLKEKLGASNVAPAVSEYERRFKDANNSDTAVDTGDYETVNNLYYDVVTDFFEYGWGMSFHFAPRVPGESFKASIARHEHYIAHKIGMQPGMVVADFGCGVGGPLMEIARFSGAKIVGINSNGYQLDRARELTAEAGLSHQSEFLHCDFLNVDAPDESFGGAYSIEATCCAPDKVSVYSEVFRVLKPGTMFGAYEYIMTDRFDPQDPHHLKLKADIQLGGGLLVIDDQETIKDALREVGFEVLETRDLAEQPSPYVPWYQPFVGPIYSPAGFRSSKIGRSVTLNTVRALEILRIAPKGSARVAQHLNLCAVAMAEAGKLGIFSPMYFIHARKPQ